MDKNEYYHDNSADRHPAAGICFTLIASQKTQQDFDSMTPHLLFLPNNR